MTEASSNEKTFILVTVLVMLLGFVLRVSGLADQPPSGDDIAVAVSAWNYTESGHLGPTMWNHPPLRNILVYFSRGLLGEGAWGLKAVSLALGTISITLLALLSRRIFKSTGIAYLAAFYLAIDPLHIDFSRQAIHEAYMMFFSLAGIYLSLQYMDRRKSFFLILSGVCFGLGMASKWYVAPALFLTYIFLIYCFMKDKQIKTGEMFSRAIFISSALLIVPVTVYVLTFIPWFLRGYELVDWVSLQKFMYVETTTHSGYNPYGFEIDHKAYLWFLKPVAFADFIFSEGKPKVLLGISNVAVWLLAIPSLIYMIYQGVRRRDIGYYYIFGLFWLTYIPLLFTRRPVWVHTAFSIIPYAFMATAYTVIDVMKGRKYGKPLLSFYIVLVIIISIPLYYLAVGKGLESDFLRPVVKLYEPSYE
jgi:4-amino-4-deoxy-L-arabinose transferase-like glycosyltransferase